MNNNSYTAQQYCDRCKKRALGVLIDTGDEMICIECDQDERHKIWLRDKAFFEEQKKAEVAQLTAQLGGRSGGGRARLLGGRRR